LEWKAIAAAGTGKTDPQKWNVEFADHVAAVH
jgi:hypothetical protein